MSLLDWFSPKKKTEAVPTVLPSSGYSRMETTRPFNAARQAKAAGKRKLERTERRELLYLVVREAMVRAGVLSSRYKFKVLSLDPQGNHFLVMIDLAQGGRNDTVRLSEIEQMIAQAARARYDILVTAVYWRTNEHVSAGASTRGQPGMGSNMGSNMGEELMVSQPAPLTEPATLPDGLHPMYGERRDEVTPSEVAALHRVISGSAGGATSAGARVGAFTGAKDGGSASAKGERALSKIPFLKSGRKSYTLLTGFEDTEMPSDAMQDLSGTQYGELR